MTKTYRLKAQPLKDQNLRINVTQDFDFLEILSLKLRQEDVYTRFCADYGVVAGRVIVNGGYGVPNANVSIFVPLDAVDENDPIISTLYPYKRPDQKNEDGFRYNLLPYVKEYGGHTPTGTFPDVEDVLKRKEVLEVYEKYYKYTVKTNESGDFMIVGVPLGIQTAVLDLDLSNIGCFSLRPADLIRLGRGTSEQFDGDQLKASTDLDSLPQIVGQKKDIDVASFWGEENICNVGITRVDFDLRDLGIQITPQAVFMGSLFSTSEEDFLKTNCKPKKDSGNLCDLVTGQGRILAIRQTINYDINGRPALEQYSLPEGGKIIDDSGTWLVNVPMNLDYVTTNEFGEQVLSTDPNVGIPTKGKYRFRIQYQNEDGMNASILRADYLVPNVKEWGWTTANVNAPTDPTAQLNSYAFSLDWDDYGDVNTTIGQQMIQEAVNCDDKFYEFNFNKVYTVANFIDRWKWGFNRSRHLGIKEITDRTCTTTTNRFPVNDGVRNFDFIFFLFSLLTIIITPTFITLIILLHVLAFLYPILRILINLVIWLINVVIYGICLAISAITFGTRPQGGCKKESIQKLGKENIFKKISLPMLSYPDCEACPCTDETLPEDATQSGFAQSANLSISSENNSPLGDTNSTVSYSTYNSILASTSNDPAAFNNGIVQAMAGYQYQNLGNDNDKLVKTPISEFPAQGGAKVLANDVTLSQSLNLANIRQRYFDGDNLIQTTVRNTIPNTTTVDASQPFTDSIMMLFVDSGTFNGLPPGQLLTFQNTDSINDPNLTGITNSNQFNTNSITGTTPYNASSLVTVPVNYITQGGVQQTVSLKLKISEDGKDYKFPAGFEYFQVITGGTVTEFSGLTNTTGGLLNKYLFKKTQRFCYGILPQQCDYVFPIKFIDNFANYEVIFLTRGTDPYTEKQNIKYDLSKIFGFNLGVGPFVEGSYYLNVPIQKNSGSGAWFNDYKTPESHSVSNNNNATLYHPPFGFTPDSTLFTAFTNNAPYYYNSTDKSQSSFKSYNSDAVNLGYFTSTPGVYSNIQPSVGNNKLAFQWTNGVLTPQGNIEGGSLIASNATPGSPINVATTTTRVYSPAYHTTAVSNISVSNSLNIVFRSDRLPTSDITEVSGNSSFSLFLNDNFSVYAVDEEGGTALAPTTNGPGDTTNNAQDLTGDTPSQVSSTVLASLSCENMTVLKCYQGGGTSFSVQNPCSENPNGKRMSGGCYKFVDNPLIVSIPKDITYFFEWKTRFRMVFAACRGIFSHVFQNNWVNGSLYMFSLKKQTIFNIVGQPKKYKFCGTPDSTLRPYQGPIFYTRGTTNSLFYRSAIYDGNKFIGQKPRQGTFFNPSLQDANFKGMNVRNLFFPTTIMDLGPRDEFTKEICTNPNFEGYLIESIKSTSYNDTSEILQLFIISRLINSNFWGQVLGLGDSSINRMFSRSEDRIDGDVAQMFSINSEYGIEEFDEDNYSDNELYLGTGDALMGIFFSSNTVNRLTLSPGIQTFTPTLTNYFGYPNTQLVPTYQWSSSTTSTIFGSDTNDWNTNVLSNGGFYSQPYQNFSFNPPTTPYFNPSTTGRRGYIYNQTPQGLANPNWPAGTQQSFIVGGPNHFYFGLNKGKSAINRYIKAYILNQDV
jgi:hypothetical protein